MKKCIIALACASIHSIFILICRSDEFVSFERKLKLVVSDLNVMESEQKVQDRSVRGPAVERPALFQSKLAENPRCDPDLILIRRKP